MFVEHTDASNNHTQTLSESLPDEDPLEEAVMDPSVLAEVTLSTRPGRFL